MRVGRCHDLVHLGPSQALLLEGRIKELSGNPPGDAFTLSLPASYVGGNVHACRISIG